VPVERRTTHAAAKTVPLTPGCTYRWILEVRDKEVVSVAFTVRTEPSAV
jgi:hypothetical protein